ncbi:MAG: TIGR03747 family integrating conjugative element membrane protein [Methylomicrobium sp.]|nr:TIGR03747 family integrating conjugative element membrane protein [Methylomicrobium sp.]
MAAPRQTQPAAQPTAEPGLFAATLTRALQAVIFLLMTLCFSILLEWLGMATGFWQAPGSQHSERMLEEELRVLNDDFQRSVIVAQPADFARRFADQCYDLTFHKTGLQAGVIWLATPTAGVNDQPFRRRLHAAYQQVHAYIEAAINVIRIFAVRLAVLTLALPAFILLALLGLTDGLVQRDIRRWSGGRESSFVYHWAKKLIYPALITPWILYLAIPDSIHPNLIVLPFAVLFAVSVRVMASTFKKYL